MLEIVRQRQRLVDMFAKAGAASNEDLELRSEWGKYLCVLVAGFLEVSLEALYSEYCTSVHPKVGRYAALQLRRVQNPKASRFIEIACSFSADWGAALEHFLNEDGRKEAVDGIMTNRHAIAHGRRCDITVARCHGYFEKCCALVGFLQAQLRL